MNALTLLFISLLGAIAAGAAVWVVAGVAENVVYALRRRKALRAPDEPTATTGQPTR